MIRDNGEGEKLSEVNLQKETVVRNTVAQDAENEFGSGKTTHRRFAVTAAGSFLPSQVYF